MYVRMYLCMHIGMYGRAQAFVLYSSLQEVHRNYIVLCTNRCRHVRRHAWAYVRMSGYFSGLIMDVTTLWVSDCYLCVSLLETLFMGYDLFMYVSSSSMH